MSSRWQHEEFLPIVRDKILQLCKNSTDWVPFDRLKKALLEDAVFSRKLRSRVPTRERRKAVSEMIGFVNEWVTLYEMGEIPRSWFEFAKETYSKIERQKIGGRWAYRIRDPELLPNYWILVGKDQDGRSSKRTAFQIYAENMRRHYWGIPETARNVARLQVGDKMVFYLGDSGNKRFFGTSTLSSRFLSKKEAVDRGYDFSGVKLVHVDPWDEPKPVAPLIPKLQFIKNKSDYRMYLRGSIHRISKKDYMVIAGRRDSEVNQHRHSLEDESRKPEPRKTEPPRFTKAARKVRSAIFRKTVREDYGYSCAVCGKSRFTKDGSPEVESSHIYPIAKNGSNDPRNGIALCRLHHWAFESGLFSIRDDYSIVVDRSIEGDRNYEEISDFKNQKIRLPEEYGPHPKFLQAHRKIHGFE